MASIYELPCDEQHDDADSASARARFNVYAPAWLKCRLTAARRHGSAASREAGRYALLFIISASFLRLRANYYRRGLTTKHRVSTTKHRRHQPDE